MGSAGQGRSDRAAALILAPALVLVVMALGSIAVDHAALHTQQRQLHAVLGAAADDAASMIDTTHLQMTGQARVDPEAASNVVAALVTDDTVPGELVGVPLVVVASDGVTVEVSARIRVEHLLLRSIRPDGGSPILDARVNARMEL